MDRALSEVLVEQFERHFKILTPDRALFIELLASTDIPESSRFSESLPHMKQTVRDGETYHNLSLRRILRNVNAYESQLSKIKGVVGSVASRLGVYHSSDLVRKIRGERELIKLMSGCPQPFSLLAKFQTYEPCGKNDNLLVTTRPILVIPGATDRKEIYDWEQSNTKYRKEIRVLGFIPIRLREKPDPYAVN
ncbi:MAG: hypothetical protein AABX96_02745 [Nanoarchaeota archaeon]